MKNIPITSFLRRDANKIHKILEVNSMQFLLEFNHKLKALSDGMYPL